jgi:hypothetical protein
MSKLMQDPEMYLVIKEKPDGLNIGILKFPMLFKDTYYLLPKDVGDKLIQEGYAIQKPINENEVLKRIRKDK